MILRESNLILISVDLALQVLDDVIMTRWRVLPREQCLGNNVISTLMVSKITLTGLFSRHSELHRQFHHRELKVGGEPEGRTRFPEQT